MIPRAGWVESRGDRADREHRPVTRSNAKSVNPPTATSSSSGGTIALVAAKTTTSVQSAAEALFTEQVAQSADNQ